MARQSLRLLSAVYESARINIPLGLFPERDDVRSWNDLDDGVRAELKNLADKIQSVVRFDEQSLVYHRRAIGEFNRGLREGFLTAQDAIAGDVTVTRGPFDWGIEIGRRAALGQDTSADTARQFIRATHLLAHEFGQLEQARGDPYGFVLRNVGPQRRDELGELAFALPVLINYRRPLVERILADQDFSFREFDADQSPTPSHLEYLTHGIVALFDPDPESWVRVAANMALAATPFEDGTTLQGEHFQAPQQAADAVIRAPIAARTMVRRQVDRVLLARDWLSGDTYGMDIDADLPRAVTLWNVYQSTPASRIRGRDRYFGDLVASNVIYLVSRYFESVIPPDQTGFQFLRRHFAAFARGFDARVEGVVDPRAIASAARGRATSEGLRRFEGGGIFIAQVSSDLQELGVALNELHFAFEQPVAYVLERLEENQETTLAAHLLELFRKHSDLARDLFRENADFDLFSKTHVKTRSSYDLLRTALYHVTRAVDPQLRSRDEAILWLDRSRDALERIITNQKQEEERRARAVRGAPPKTRVAPILSHDDAITSGPGRQDELEVMAQLLINEFDTFVRLMRTLVSQVHHARVLGKPWSVLSHGGGLAAQGA